MAAAVCKAFNAKICDTTTITLNFNRHFKSHKKVSVKSVRLFSAVANVLASQRLLYYGSCVIDLTLWTRHSNIIERKILFISS